MFIAKKRFVILKTIIILIFLIIIYRLYSIQIKDIYGYFNEYNRYKNNKQIIPADRGIIYDRNGIPLAGNKKIFKLELCSSILNKDNRDSLTCSDSVQIFKEITQIITHFTDKSSDYLFKNIRKFKNKYRNGFELIRNLDVEQKNAIISEINSRKIKGIRCFKQESIRIYPKNELAGAVIGLYQSRNALCGLELSFDKYLTGINGWTEIIKYGTGEKHHFSDMKQQASVIGNSIYLTVDYYIQAVLEKHLRQDLVEYNAKNAVGIIISPESGEILAMCGLNENKLNSSPHEIHSLPIYSISWLFEPGSTIKPFTALLALEKDLYKSSDSIDCRTRRIGHRIISDIKEFEYLTLKEIIAYSSTTGITRVVDKINDFNFYNHLLEFGFGYKTGIMLPGEQSGIIRKPSRWSGYTKHSMSFGQEMCVTPIQLVYAYAALANGGLLLEPRLVKKITNNQNNNITYPRVKIRNKISSKNILDTLKSYLQAVVDEGYGKAAKLDYVNIAGKTGTAEKKKKKGKGYEENKFISSFIGFFPVKEPKIVMLIIFDEPDYLHRFGSQSAARTFKKITEELIILPNTDLLDSINKLKSNYMLVPDCIGWRIERAVTFLKEQNISFSYEGSGAVVVNQFPKPGISLLDNASIILITEY